jgi:lipopolysaccharide/colanic/teichoic acid biosynthesis glycosyltransferase
MPSDILSGVMQSGSRGWPTTVHRREPRILSVEFFNGVLKNERKRAERCNQPFVVLVVAADDQPDAAAAFMWNPVVEAMAALTRETDVMGWIARRSVLGVIMTEVRTLDAAAAHELEALVARELVARLDAETAAKLSIRLQVHSEQKRTEEAGTLPGGPQRTTYDAIKRGLDVVGSLLLLVALAPVLFLLGALVKLTSRGPVFFGQERVGQRMKPFTVLKFRTMYVNADPKLHRDYVTDFIKKSNSQGPKADENTIFKLTNDPRVTFAGRILRKTSLDELPQLWNVLRGDMSLVGPRPPIPYEVEQYKPWHCRRVLEAKPGITGLWQVTGRGRTTFDDMVRLDLRYVRTCSLRTDLKILLATPRAVISGRVPADVAGLFCRRTNTSALGLTFGWARMSASANSSISTDVRLATRRKLVRSSRSRKMHGSADDARFRATPLSARV